MLKDRMKVVIDTNLLVRYLANDEPPKARAVDALLDRAGRGELRILFPSVVVAELVWVLESFYQIKTDEIAELVGAVLNTPGVEIEDKAVIRAALKIYRNKEIDFVDAWIIEFAKDREARRIYTFDKKHFKDTGETEVAIPG